MAVSDSVQDEGLVRVIGTGALGLSVVNMVVGAGIFVLPGLVAAGLGSAAILAYLICSLTVALVFLFFAEVGSHVSRSGGAYAYVEEAFGPFVGFVASILLFYAFNGAESALSVSGEIKNPAKTVPLGLLLGLAGILLLYVGLQTVAQGVLGPELANNTEAPLVAVATEVFGDYSARY